MSLLQKKKKFQPRNFVAMEFPLSRQDFFKSFAIFNRDKKLFGCNRFFFSGSCHLLSCLSQHRIMCCDTIALAILKSSSISVVTYFSLIAAEFYHSLAFIVVIENFFVATQVLPATFDYFTTRSFFASILLVLLFSILSRQGIHLLHVLFVATKIIFVAIEIVLPLVVNSNCYVAT